jgi:hypothetical protein
MEYEIGQRALLLKRRGVRGAGAAVWYPSRATFPPTEETPYEITVTVAIAPDDDRLDVREITVRAAPDGPRVDGQSLRTVPLAAMRDQIIRAASVEATSGPDGRPLFAHPGFWPGSVPGDDATLRMASAQPGSRHELSDEHLAEVAAVYREAVAQGKRTTATVADHFCTSQTTARRWVSMARQRKLLGKAIGRKAGEQ